MGLSYRLKERKKEGENYKQTHFQRRNRVDDAIKDVLSNFGGDCIAIVCDYSRITSSLLKCQKQLSPVVCQRYRKDLPEIQSLYKKLCLVQRQKDLTELLLCLNDVNLQARIVFVISSALSVDQNHSYCSVTKNIVRGILKEVSKSCADKGFQTAIDVLQEISEDDLRLFFAENVISGCMDGIVQIINSFDDSTSHNTRRSETKFLSDVIRNFLNKWV